VAASHAIVQTSIAKINISSVTQVSEEIQAQANREPVSGHYGSDSRSVDLPENIDLYHR
jgi:hypothetical protein